MERKFRIQKLKEIQNGDSYGSGIKIPYREEKTRKFNTYQIPLEYLIYNKYNGRIRSLVKTFEKHYHDLDPENLDHVKKIEEYLWKSNKGRNENTEENIAELGQRVHGIVTADGKIIDGNRRAMLLKRIYSQRHTKYQGYAGVDGCQYFIAAILPDDINEKEIRQLETMYQMGEDVKLDYNAIEKYLMVKELLDENSYGFSEKDVAKWMGQSIGKIKEWKETMVLMDDYLKELGYQEIYTMLDKREDLFLSLNKDIKKYDGGNIPNGDWSPTENDIVDLKLISYDYIRSQVDGKQFRSISRGSKGENFFSTESIWKPFRDYHFNQVEPITENEKTVDEWRQENQDADISDFLPQRDEEWKNQVDSHLGRNFGTANSRLEDKKNENEPRELITKAKNALDSISDDAISLIDQDIDDMLKDMISRINDLRKTIKKSL